VVERDLLRVGLLATIGTDGSVVLEQPLTVFLVGPSSGTTKNGGRTCGGAMGLGGPS